MWTGIAFEVLNRNCSWVPKEQHIERWLSEDDGWLFYHIMDKRKPKTFWFEGKVAEAKRLGELQRL